MMGHMHIPTGSEPPCENTDELAIRMLVILQNGEQRLITFTLSIESCTVQDLLEQVGIPFAPDTNIQCVSNPGAEIDYTVTVGQVDQSAQVVEPSEPEYNSSQPQQCQPDSTNSPDKSPDKPKSPEPPREPPARYIPGMLALCKICGYTGADFNKCQRCKRKFPNDPKAIPITEPAKEKENTRKPTPIKETARITKPSPEPAKRGRKPRVKVPEPEPEVLTLSSDEEEHLQKRIESLQQQNRVLKVELETYKLRVKALQEENRGLRQASVIIQFQNTLLKKIQALKKEKETLAHHYEREEECLTNDLSRKLNQLRQEKCRLEQTLEQEQECLVNKLMRKIEKLEAETLAKQTNLEQLRREKVELENTLEQEQEALVNKLWSMDKLEAEKRSLQIKLDQPVSDPASPREINNGGDTATNLSAHIQILRSEVSKLRTNLAQSQQEHTEKMQRYVQEERCIREENLRLQRKLQLEVERREALCRHLSESESSLEMEEERHYNESVIGVRQRTVSSPVPNPSPSVSRPLSPGPGVRCYACGQTQVPSCCPPLSNVFHPIVSSSPPASAIAGRRTSERFIKPAIPTVGLSVSNTSLSNTGSNSMCNSSVVNNSLNLSGNVFAQPASPMDTSVCKD